MLEFLAWCMLLVAAYLAFRAWGHLLIAWVAVVFAAALIMNVLMAVVALLGPAAPVAGNILLFAVGIGYPLALVIALVCIRIRKTKTSDGSTLLDVHRGARPSETE